MCLGGERGRSKSVVLRTIPAVFLSDGQRTFNNPISYLGGPILPSQPRSSLESVLSLD